MIKTWQIALCDKLVELELIVWLILILSLGVFKSRQLRRNIWLRWLVIQTDNKVFYRCKSTTFRFDKLNSFEEISELGFQEFLVISQKHLGDEGAIPLQSQVGDVKSCNNEWTLDVLIDVVDASHIRSTVTDH